MRCPDCRKQELTDQYHKAEKGTIGSLPPRHLLMGCDNCYSFFLVNEDTRRFVNPKKFIPKG